MADLPNNPDNGLALDITKVPSFVAPSNYANGTYTATQEFEFDDTATGETNIKIPGLGSGPLQIVRTVQFVDSTHYLYTVTKDGISNSLSLPTP